MNGFALISIPIVAGIGLVGLLLVVTGFYVHDDDVGRELPTAQIVARGANPIRTSPPAGVVRVSANRIVVGVIIMMFAGAAMMFLLGEAKVGDGMSLRVRS